MSTSKFRITKTCLHCSSLFEAQKVNTKFCSLSCAQKNYKLRKRIEQTGGKLELPESGFNPITNAVKKELVKDLDFLTVKEAAKLLNCCTKTIYRMIKLHTIKARAISQRKTLIRRKDIDALFEK